ncbi:ABC transporter permease subunit [Xylanimonas allomyrinae]|uniref:ABC transporter permease subunit n=1 Tax=Xylanimonas allomyrinae TaxID=2509459 RepID=A0A4P6EMV3_9MICO|nr:ABC transporter permease subunit [Xylanimonas allomyrinae]QAY62619.1 ABC transporter permease subunit [Xylanimonas allomyrinae]
MLRSFAWSDLQALARGAVWTITLCVTAGLLGTVLGLAIALAATSPVRALRWLAHGYVTLVRGIPLLILVFFAYFGIPLFLPGLELSAFATAVVALTVFAAAYLAEVFRGSLNAVPAGQYEAASALGLGYAGQHRFVILPQALRIAVPRASDSSSRSSRTRRW